jgi:hypothetical protein
MTQSGLRMAENSSQIRSHSKSPSMIKPVTSVCDLSLYLRVSDQRISPKAYISFGGNRGQALKEGFSPFVPCILEVSSGFKTGADPAWYYPRWPNKKAPTVRYRP